MCVSCRCTILAPGWVTTGSQPYGVETIDGVQCYGYAKHGAVAAADVWYADKDGVPCRYHEVGGGTVCYPLEK